MADLPEARVIPEEAPFTRVGVDYFGPIEVKRGRSIIKRYGVVFRAIHRKLTLLRRTLVFVPYDDLCQEGAKLRRFCQTMGQT